jgi:imidazolonepropionase
VPPEFKGRTDEYVELVIREMIPSISKKKLARFCDVFCEEGVFSVEQSRRILKSAWDAGMAPKLHADEMVDLGGSALAAELAAVSADHLLMANEENLKKMADAGTMGVLLPATPFALMMADYPDARKMIEMGVPLALATDLNPNCYTESMPFIIALACYHMGMTPAEAMVASTINAAHAIAEQDRVGSLEVGKDTDLVILDAPNHMHVPYHFGVNLVDTVIKKGKVVVEGGRIKTGP